MAAKRRKVIAEDINIGYGPTTIPTDSGGLRAASLMGIHKLLGDAYVSVADFAGTDMGAKIANAITVLPSTGGTVDARSLRGAQSASVNPFSGVTKPVKLLLADVTISATAPWLMSGTSQMIEGAPGATLKYTGSATDHAVGLDGSATVNGVKFRISHLHIDANGLATYGIFLDGSNGTHLENVSITNCVTAGFRLRSCVLNIFINPTVSSNATGAYTTTPVNGILMESGGVFSNNSANQFLNPRIENVSGSGIKLINCFNGVFIGGTSEGNNIGIELAGVSGLNVYNNTFTGIDLESNTTRDIDINLGQSNNFIGINSSHASSSVRLTANTGNNRFYGGSYITGPLVQASSNTNQFHGIQTNTAISDSGTGTVIDAITVLGTYQTNQMPQLKLAYGETSNQQLALDNTTGCSLYYVQSGNSGFHAGGGVAQLLANGTKTLHSTSNGVAIGRNSDISGPGGNDLLVQDQTASTGTTLAIVKAGAADTATSTLFAVQDNGGTTNLLIDSEGGIRQTGVTFANLPAGMANGYIIYCTDGQVTSGADNTAKAGGTGCLVVRLNGVWRAFAAQN